MLESIKVQIGLVSDIERIKSEIDNSGYLERRKQFLNENINKCEEQIDIKRKLRKDAYEYEDKKIKIKFKYEDEYNYLIDFIKRRKKFIS